MNILIINFEYPPLGGGGGVATADIAGELAKRHTVHVLTTAFPTLPRFEVVDGVHIHRVPVLGRFALPTASFLSLITFAPVAFFAGIFMMRKVSFDIIYTQFVIPSGLPAALLSKLFSIPFVLTFIGGDIYDPSKGISPHRHALFRMIIRWIATRAAVRTAISHDTKTRTIELHGVTKDIQVVPIGLKKFIAKEATRSELGFSDKDIICVSIGRLVPRKGYDVLLAAWKDIPEAKLIIIGNGPLRADLSHTIKKYGLSNRVQLLGQVEEEKKAQLLRIADMYVSAAQHEGFGIVFLEAMNAGLAIVAANDGGQRDFLENGENAILIAPHDVRALVRAVQTLIKDIHLRHTMGTKNKKAVENYYIDRTAARIEDILIQARKKSYERNN
jgi:glycosyltransferase involved in cell wall biosynthesis